jgi:hypothetical protein
MVVRTGDPASRPTTGIGGFRHFRFLVATHHALPWPVNRTVAERMRTPVALRVLLRGHDEILPSDEQPTKIGPTHPAT